MKKSRLIYLSLMLSLMFLFTSCGPTIHYLGESYPPSTDIEVFYDVKDVKRDYKVIGKMTNDELSSDIPEQVRAQMVERAKQAGGDAIIFTDLGVDRTEVNSGSLVVKANVIKYTE
ncbi:hypothetical protein [Pontibacter akesuensis]|uniref:Uncharacterized protein n=1 Tax=Pontibacter akesuensis TaxID=388950 RepID=A0A1I7H3I3_9BACT|nr:hypothetical protein [Pontibacter akesuensis]SFU55182.1 hypothetical protein SAMN04487941_1469 [Pontibacter akesuensis]